MKIFSILFVFLFSLSCISNANGCSLQVYYVNEKGVSPEKNNWTPRAGEIPFQINDVVSFFDNNNREVLEVALNFHSTDSLDMLNAPYQSEISEIRLEKSSYLGWHYKFKFHLKLISKNKELTIYGQGEESPEMAISLDGELLIPKVTACD